MCWYNGGEIYASLECKSSEISFTEWNDISRLSQYGIDYS